MRRHTPRPPLERGRNNGKEYQDENGLDWYDYGFRSFDRTIARWHVIEPLIEMYLNISPYSYCLGDPERYIDLFGLSVKKSGDTTTITGDDIYTYYSNLSLAEKNGNWDNFNEALDAAIKNNNP